ncbi:glycosyltransferase [Corallincola spongiicola]|uniref:Glycosyltransferase family 1 protein n=1 Tax=Corallincola spongiicola TaxID=2520508 RepID=A0ABY1WQ00_9GAMM|nr:glycosyltransferase family 1 protein [Corallincola spongiicola]TAA46792.1 glycosyltransferase family 1 protein [Corallincola spongiicola]
MSKQEKIRICVGNSGHGIQKDATIIMSTLREVGIASEIIYTKVSNFQNKLPWRLRKAYFFLVYIFFKLSTVFFFKKYDVMVHIQRIDPGLSARSRKNILIPNQEWFLESAIPLVNLVDTVLVKTFYAETIFKKINSDTRFLGFTSSDTKLDYPPSEAHLKKSYLHRAGNSAHRGTKTLINLWSKHPEWPTLTILIGKHRLPDTVIPTNVQVITDFLSDEEFERVMRENPFHIHPTMTEGYGLTMSEGIAMGCIPIVTNAPPMNELADREFSFLVNAQAKGCKGLSALFEIDKASLESVIQETIEMSFDEQRVMAMKGQRWHQTNYEMFKRNLKRFFAEKE